MSLVRTFFLIVLVGQVLLSILNSLFLLSDLNLVLSLFGFYGNDPIIMPIILTMRRMVSEQ